MPHRGDGPTPIHDAARRALLHAGHVLPDHIHHQHHPATPTPDATMEAPAMTTPTTAPAIDQRAISADFAAIRAMVDAFGSDRLPSVLDFVRALADNPVVPALLRAQHVPPEKLAVVARMVDTIAELTPKPGAAQAAPKDASPVKPGA